MDFNLKKPHLMAINLFREFAEKELKPYVEEMDEEERLSGHILGRMRDCGLLGIPFSKEYGGEGGDFLTNVLCVEELSKISPTVAGIISVQASAVASAIKDFGTDYQKDKYLRQLASGKSIGSFSITEPGAGSDAAKVQTKAFFDGENYILNGTKIFVTNAGFADIFIIGAMTDKSKGVKGISTFLIEKDFPGFTVGKEERKMGLRGSSTCELILDNCVVPKGNLLGKEGQGFKIAMKAIDGGRITIGAQSVGIAQGCIDEAIKYVKERKQFNSTISGFQNTQFQLADMQTKTDAARLLTYRAAVLKDEGKPFTLEASMAKLFASENANDVARRAVQMFGGYGYTREYPVERMMRDAKITEIYDGTSEIQKWIISGFMNVK
jgi:butyryl-CoA dehydrogenase